MTSTFARKAGLKLFEQHLSKYEPADPVYETYTDAKGRQKQRKRELPPGLSKRDAKILRKVKNRAHHLDKGFNICGMRFGWTFIIGLVPMAGDATDAALNYLLVVRKARQAEYVHPFQLPSKEKSLTNVISENRRIPDWLVRSMLMNNAAAAALGFIPLAGDVGVAIFKTNSRNAALLEEFLRIRGEEFLKAQSLTGKTTQDAGQMKPGAGLVKGETASKK
ncbi:hypothetical protein DFH11DRAFT_1518907 [Phellopilus nigrolimitatus]|nr:hypothetical protein DFH11DRAFT_1518907 [Phellopilus nigrolimitatus]